MLLYVRSCAEQAASAASSTAVTVLLFHRVVVAGKRNHFSFMNKSFNMQAKKILRERFHEIILET